MNMTGAEHIKIRSCWADVMAMNHFDGQNFVRQLFANLMASNADVKQLFHDPADLAEHEALFTELLKFTMMYLDKRAVLEDCMEEFIRENPQLVRFGVSYLEPMGAVLIKTLRQVLGPERFHAGLETLWIKVYIYLANCILLHDASDAESTHSEERPLKTFSSPVPAFRAAAGSDHAADLTTIRIDLGNERYRGFRRSVNEPVSAKVAVAVPATFSRAEPASEPVLTPRSSRRNSAQQLHELGVDGGSPYLLTLLYDPRRKGHRRTPLDLSLNMEQPERKISLTLVESPVSDVDDQYRLEDEMDFSQPAERSAFDHTSFGIKGLAPIAESEDDGHSLASESSNYAATLEKSSADEASSRTSSLSLHNLDYKLSISSGSARLGFTEKSPRAKNFAPPQFAYQHAYLSLVPLLMSKSSGQRASLGFMRSSYILKKEMHDMGYNYAENVVSHEHLAKAVPCARSVYSLPLPKEPYQAKHTLAKTIKSAPVQPVEEKSKEKTLFRKKLSSMFGSKPAKERPVVASKERQAPRERHISAPVAAYTPKMAPSLAPSVLTNRMRMLDFRKPAGYASSVYMEHDNASVMSVGSHKSRMSLFKSKDKEPKKTNKYLVKKVPHKTVYLKDLIA